MEKSGRIQLGDVLCAVNDTVLICSISFFIVFSSWLLQNGPDVGAAAANVAVAPAPAPNLGWLDSTRGLHAYMECGYCVTECNGMHQHDEGAWRYRM